MERKRMPILGKFIAGVAAILLVACLALVVMVRLAPSIGANGADQLRKIVGDQPVALMEMALYQVQDIVQQAGYHLGVEKPVAPWQAIANGNIQPESVPSAGIALAGKSSRPAQDQTGGHSGLDLGKIFAPGAARSWPPAPVHPMGTIAGEGLWQPYLYDQAGRVVAYRAFLQPDLRRPYALIGLVAFDLHTTRLNLQLGTEEPYQNRATWRADGLIPAENLVPGKILAAFNGGFRVAHGHYGAMLDGHVAVPPREGIATLVFYKDGHITLGPWDPAVQHASDVAAYRQNGPLVIQDGQLTPQVDDPRNWGYTVNGATVTWRSGLGMSRDGHTLIYFAGPNLTIHTLATAMQAAGVYNAMQLDINNYWVHFSTFTVEKGKLTPVPLFPDQMKDGSSRFLYPYSRDFFYVTTP